MILMKKILTFLFMELMKGPKSTRIFIDLPYYNEKSILNNYLRHFSIHHNESVL